jgi:hypothetical protein
MNEHAAGPQVGDEIEATEMRAAASTGASLSIDRFVGKVPLVVVAVEGLDDDRVVALMTGLDEHLVDFGHATAQALVVASADPTGVDAFRQAHPGNTPIIADAEMAWAEVLGLGEVDRPVAVIVERNGVVAHSGPVELTDHLAIELLARLGALEHDHPDGGAGS